MNVVKEQSAIYAERRKRLSSAVGGEPIYLSGHTALPRNFAANVYRFRQDSTFLFFSGVSQPGCGLRIDEGGRSTLYVPPADPSDALWHGEQPTFEDLGKRSGVDDVRPVSEGQSRGCHRLPVTDPTVLTETPSERLVEAVIQLRMCRDETEVAAIRSALRVTGEAHRWAMAATRPGLYDHEIEALIEYVFSLRGMGLAYPSIVTKRGEVLHGHAEGLELGVGDLLLVDAGAEEAGGYASDITRTWPVSGRFTARQRAVYEAVLEAQKASIDLLKPGVRYKEVHLESARVLTQFARDEGLLRGDLDGLVEAGCHAVFFPHGVGHLLGLDVHDMELYGDRVGYPVGRDRETQFGLSFLRLDRDMSTGMVVTVEPGFYVVPAILRDVELRTRLGDSVNWDLAESWLGFGGVRIEDDVLVTDVGYEVLSADIPRELCEIEDLVGSGDLPNAQPRASSV